MFLAEIVFASRILGLVAGEQHVNVQVDAVVQSIEVLKDGTRVAALHQPPWKTVVDFGPELTPHELTVVAFDREGREIARDTQAVNVTHPPAELGVLLHPDGKGQITAEIRWSHFAHRDPSRVVVKLDGRGMKKGRTARMFPLGAVDMSRIHVLGVEVSFPDRLRSRKEIVFGGVAFSEQMPAEMTPVAVRQRGATTGAAENCFRVGEEPLAAVTVERGEGAAIFILNGGRELSRRVESPEHRGGGLFALHDAQIDIVDPVAQNIRRDGSVTRLFDTDTMDGSKGTKRVIAMMRRPPSRVEMADAVGAAALRALRGGRRRVVVVVLGESPAPDRSVHAPGTMRRYLERVGVPLRVWSLTGPRPDLAETWGEVQDVSSAAGLLKATEDLRRELDSQRVAWMPVAPLDAFRVIANTDCAYAPLAGAGYALTPADRAASAR